MRGSLKAVLRWLQENGDSEKTYEVKEVRRKRTLTQNAYYWELLSQLAEVLKLSNEEMHFHLLRRYSTASIWAAKDYVDPYRFYKYCVLDSEDEAQGIRYWRFYQPSSEMDTKDFTRLLDGLISECKEVGIETATPEELARIRRE